MRNKIKIIVLLLSFALIYPPLSGLAKETDSPANPPKQTKTVDQFRVVKGIRQMMAAHLKKQGKNLVKMEQMIQRIEAQGNRVQGADKSVFDSNLEKTKSLATEARELLAVANGKYGKPAESGTLAKSELKVFLADTRKLQSKFKEVKQAALNTLKALKALEKKAIENKKLKKTEKTKTNDGAAVVGKERQ